MVKSCEYVGCDVGSEELWVAVAGRKARCFEHTVLGIKRLVAWIRGQVGRGPVHVCMEATGVYSEHAAMGLLVHKGIAVSIVNPAQVKAFGRAQLCRTKTDAVDAGVILAFAQSQKPPVWHPPTDAQRRLVDLVHHWDSLKQEQEQWRNRQHANRFRDSLPVDVKRSQQRLLKRLEEEQRRIEEAIRKLVSSHQPLQDMVDVLCTIKGVGFNTSIRVLAYGGDVLVTRSAKAVTAHAGLAPGHRRSGKSVRGKTRIVKHGDSDLRRSIYMATLVATRYNPTFKNRYEHLQSQGKAKKQALIACMRKMLLTMRAMIKNNQPFIPDYA